ncbi:MAG: hypothetical protein CMK96_02410 [Pseudomonas sp.]|nr:hypothetical protein [Pseudomonadales bacterium]MAK85811.1 hypothetical protein [Pseudomonas sp.]HAG77581.1 hypothetical protein [Pseudomonas sp.]HCH78864.1 hypothetical protein [Pseudomonas sp.]
MAVLMIVGAWLAPKETDKQAAERAARSDEESRQEAERDADKAENQRAEQEKYTAIAAAKRAVTQRLNDPDSAKFGKVVRRPSGIVCGYVNAKNAMGGYAGEKGFIVMAGKAWLETDSADFGETWNKHCAS